MTEETQPKKKKRARKRKPAKKKVLSEGQLNSIELEKCARALSTDELAVALLSTEFSMEHAASTLGWDIAAVKQVWASPVVQRWLMKAQEIFMHKLASTRVRMLKKVNCTPTEVEQRLMQLAQMDPADTKGSIDGQVKALRTLAEVYGLFDPEDPLKGKNRDQLRAMVRDASSRLIDAGEAQTRPQ